MCVGLGIWMLHRFLGKIGPFENIRFAPAVLRFKDSLLMMVMQCAIRLEDTTSNVSMNCQELFKSWSQNYGLFCWFAIFAVAVLNCCRILLRYFKWFGHILSFRTLSLDLLGSYGKFPDLFRGAETSYSQYEPVEICHEFLVRETSEMQNWNVPQLYQQFLRETPRKP